MTDKTLVDDLAEALYWLLMLRHGRSKGGKDPQTGEPYPVTDEEWERAVFAGVKAHARYLQTKEAADAE